MLIGEWRVGIGEWRGREVKQVICPEAQRRGEERTLDRKLDRGNERENPRRWKTPSCAVQRVLSQRRLRPLVRNIHVYDRVMPIQKAAVRMPVRSSIRRRRFLRTATIITPLAQIRKPSSGQNMEELKALLEALAGS